MESAPGLFDNRRPVAGELFDKEDIIMIKGSAFSLRIIQKNDLHALFQLLNDTSNKGKFYPRNMASEPEFYRNFNETGFWGPDFGRLLIVDHADKILGIIHYFTTTPYFNALEIGYLLFDDENKRKGIMTEALTLFTRHLFRTKNINRLELRIMPRNQPSIRVAEKAGYVFEGTARKCSMYNGSHADMNVYSILREEFFQRAGIVKRSS